MSVLLSPDQQAFVRQAIENGRLRHEDDAIHEALALWEDRERTRAEILAAVEIAEASIARGEGRRVSTIEESREFAKSLTKRGMARLASEESKLG